MKRAPLLAIVVCITLCEVPIASPLVARSAETLCTAQLMALPWAAERDGPIAGPSSDRYGLFVVANAKSTVSARILLSSDDDLYSVSINEGKIFPK